MSSEAEVFMANQIAVLHSAKLRAEVAQHKAEAEEHIIKSNDVQARIRALLNNKSSERGQK